MLKFWLFDTLRLPLQQCSNYISPKWCLYGLRFYWKLRFLISLRLRLLLFTDQHVVSLTITTIFVWLTYTPLVFLLFLPLQYQNLLWLTCPTAMFTIRPQSPGDCLMITFPQITTWLNIAGKHELIISVIRKKNNLNRHDGELHHFCYNRTCSSLQILFQLPWLFWHKYIINISYQSSVKVWSCLIYKRQNNMFTAVTISGL